MALTSRLLGGGCFLLLIGAVASCTSLEDIELGVCGNGVLDPGEDCDGHEKNGVSCGEPGTSNACRYVCDFASETPVCPDADYRCGATNVCARADDGLVPGAELDLGGVGVVVADFDGDKIDDIGVADTDARELVVSFLGAGTNVELEQRLAIDGPLVAAGRLTDDDRADLIITSEGSVITLSSAGAERALVGNAATLVPVKMTRLIGVPARALPGEAAKLGLEPDTVLGGVLVDDGFVYFQNPFTFSPQTLVSIGPEVSPADLVGFFKARLYPVSDGQDPCDELIVVRADTNELTVVQMCRDGVPILGNEACAGDDNPCVQSTPLAATPVAAFPLNLDGDPELELVVVEQEGTVTSLETFEGAAASPDFEPTPSLVDAQLWLDALLDSQVSPDANVLSIGFINDDADLDFVRSDGVYLSKRLFADPDVPPSYFRAAAPSAGDWREAIVGDFGGDERVDVVATSGVVGDGIELRIGTSSSYMNGVTVAVEAAAAELTSGDFDGDGVTDVVYRERPTSDVGAVSCDVVDSVVVRFGARDDEVFSDVRVLSRVSGVEDLVAGPLPRFDTRDSISDFASASRCGGTEAADISLFYGAVNRQVAAPKVLLDDLDVGPQPQVIVPYTPVAVSSFDDSSFVATLGGQRFLTDDGAGNDTALFVLGPDQQGLIEDQHIALIGGDEHAGIPATAFRIAVTRLGDPDNPAVAIVDPLHIHLIEGWADLPDTSDKPGARTIEAFGGVPLSGEGAVIDLALGGDVTGDGHDDLIVAGQSGGAPFLRVHASLSDDPGSFTDLLDAADAGGGVLAAALLPRDDVAGADVKPFDLVVALADVGAAVIRYQNGAFVVVETLPFKEITTVAVGDVDGDQFADVVLVSQDRVRAMLRKQRFAGDAGAPAEEGAQ